MRLVIEKITIPQKCDMGSGDGYLEITDKVTLAEVLEFYKYSNSWGIITIYNDSGEIIRKFDYDVHYDHDILYHQLSSWEYKLCQSYSYSLYEYTMYLSITISSL